MKKHVTNIIYKPFPRNMDSLLIKREMLVTCGYSVSRIGDYDKLGYIIKEIENVDREINDRQWFKKVKQKAIDILYLLSGKE